MIILTKKQRFKRVKELYNDGINNISSFELTYGVSGKTPIGADLLYLVGAIVGGTKVEEISVSLRNYLDEHYPKSHWIWDYIVD